MPWGEAVAAAAWLAAVVSAAAAVGALAATVARGDLLERSLTALFAAVTEVLTVCVLLAALGLYSRGWLFGAQVVIGVAAFAAVSRSGDGDGDGDGDSDGDSALRPDAMSWPNAGLVVAGFAVGVLVLSLGLGLRSGRSLHFESLHYHFAGLAQLVTGHTLWSLPFQNPAFFTANHPQNAELLYGVFALATGGDHLVYVLNTALFGALTVLASAVLVRRAGTEAWVGALAGVAALSVPIVFATQTRSLATDFPAVGFVLAALAFLLSSDARPTWLLLAGAALGAGVGTKYTVLVPVAVVVLAALVRLGVRRSLWLLPGLLVLGAPWFVRNWVETGNPVFPQAVAVGDVVIFEGGETPLAPLSNTVLSHVVHQRTGALGTWAGFVRDLYGPLALVAAVGVPVALLRRGRDPSVARARAIGALGAVAVVTYLTTPYTGAGVPPLEFLIASNLRYALLAVTLGAVAIAVVLPKRLAAVLLVASAGWSVWKLVVHPLRVDLEPSPKLLVLAVLAALVVPVVGSIRLPRPPAVPAGGAATVAAVGVFGVACALFYGALAGPRGNVAEAPLEKILDAVASDGRVLVVGVDDLRSVVGAEFARTPVGVTPGPSFASEPFESSTALASAVDSEDVDVLVVSRGEHPGVPKAFEPSEQWCEVASADSATVYRRLDPGGECPAPGAT